MIFNCSFLFFCLLYYALWNLALWTGIFTVFGLDYVMSLCVDKSLRLHIARSVKLID